MLTLFTCPKPFIGHIRIIQRNAIQSWLAQKNGFEIILIGEDDGIAETASEFGLIHIPKVECNEYGTPLINSIFALAQERAINELLCYINADILLLDDLIGVIKKISLPDFLMVGRRWDLDVFESINFGDNSWKDSISDLIKKKGILQIPNAIDYFIFKRGSIKQLPSFAVGRPGWDNWVIYNSWKKGIPIIDATESLTVVHQNHGYSHVPKHSGFMWEGPEAQKNRELMGVVKNYRFSILDATHVLKTDGLKRAYTEPYLRRKWKRIPLFYPWIYPLHRLINGLLRKVLK